MVKDKKVLPHLSSYANDPERIEEQANRMAKEGWILEKFGSLFSTYRRGGRRRGRPARSAQEGGRHAF